jgi:hypothetical protein
VVGSKAAICVTVPSMSATREHSWSFVPWTFVEWVHPASMSRANAATTANRLVAT